MSRFDVGLRALAALPRSEVLPLVIIPAAFIVAFLVFLGRCALRGMPRTERIALYSKERLVPTLLLEYGYWVLKMPRGLLLALGVRPDTVSILSLLLGLGGAVAFAVGRFGLGGWLVYVSFFCDALDGMLARAYGTCSARGEFFDALIDRYVDFAAMFGILWYYRADPLPLGLVMLAIVGSSVMGYARAKGEAVGVDPNVGLMQRQERAFILGSLTCLAPIAAAFLEPGSPHPRYHLVLIALALIAFFTNVTSIWRAWYVMARLRRAPSGLPERGLEAEPSRDQTA